MKALSVNQPWAWLIVHHTKWIENRTRRVNYRGPLAIHAGKNQRWLADWYAPTGMALAQPMPPRDELIFGAAIGLCDLVDCVRASDAKVRNSEWRDPGGWCLILANRRPIEPVYCRGQLGLFNVELDAVCVKDQTVEVADG